MTLRKTLMNFQLFSSWVVNGQMLFQIFEPLVMSHKHGTDKFHVSHEAIFCATFVVKPSFMLHLLGQLTDPCLFYHMQKEVHPSKA